MNKKNFFLDNNTVLMIISVLGAILLWVMVAYNVGSNISVIIRNVPVVIDENDSNISRLNLYAVTNADFTVDVELSGPRATVGNVKTGEISVSARLNNVSGPGSYNLALDISDLKNRDIEIIGTVPNTVTMRFDNRVTKRLSISPEFSGLVIPDGYIMDEEYLYPNTVEVSGPATEMQNVMSAVVRLDFDAPVTESNTYDSKIVLLNSEGDEVESQYFDYSSENISVTVPVLKKKTVPITFDFVNIPSGFDISTFNYVISPQEIEVAGPKEAIDSFDAYHLGYLDVRTTAPDIHMFYRLSLPPGFISVEGIEDIDIAFDPDGFDETLLSVESDNIYVINKPSGFDVTVQSKNIANVTVYGPSDVIEALSSKDLIAQIDISDIDDSRTGQITVPVEILIPGKNNCWAFGDDYTARVTILVSEDTQG